MQNILAGSVHHLERRAGIVVTVLERALEQFDWSRSRAWRDGENNALAVTLPAFFDERQAVARPNNPSETQKEARSL